MSRHRRFEKTIYFLAVFVWVTGFFVVPSVRADDVTVGQIDRFADEPLRPKARVPIHFLDTFAEARAEAQRSRRRILAYFTGPHCGWCRVMEKRTFTDAEVVELSLGFVCVKLDSEKDPELHDKLGVDAIPRSFILTSEGATVDMLADYRPATEYAEWLRTARAKQVGHVPDENPKVPTAVGATEKEAGFFVWFLDGPRTMSRWADPKAFEHALLLKILKATGSAPRLEHMAFSDFPERWQQAAEANRLPHLIASEKLPATARDLERQGQLLAVISQRLIWMPGLASCPDFAGRSLHLLHGGPHESKALRGLELILQPGPETELPGPRLPDAADPAGAENVARRAITSYMAGDPLGLKEVASEASPQLSRCVKPQAWRLGLKVDTGPIEIRGGKDFAFAKIETTYRGKENMGADWFLVVLRSESSRWRAFAVTGDIESWKWVPDFLALVHPRDGAPDPAIPRLVWPADRALLADLKRPLVWQIPEGGDTIVAQVCMLMGEEVHADAPGESWPYATLVMRPGKPRGGSIPASRYHPGFPARWCVWSIGIGGRMSVSDVRGYDLANREKAGSP